MEVFVERDLLRDETPITPLTAIGSFVIECPPMVASPEVGVYNVESIEMVVVFPAPFGIGGAEFLLMSKDISERRRSRRIF
ncbi:MAG: hypothetical protein U0V48_07475 [Anaerolineales bacterium]